MKKTRKKTVRLPKAQSLAKRNDVLYRRILDLQGLQASCRDKSAYLIEAEMQKLKEDIAYALAATREKLDKVRPPLNCPGCGSSRLRNSPERKPQRVNCANVIYCQSCHWQAPELQTA